MSMFDTLMQETGGLDLASIGARVGLSPEQVQSASSRLLPQVADPDVDNQDATAAVADETGIPHSKLQALLPVLLEHIQGSGAGGGVAGTIMSALGGGNGGGGGGGMLGGLEEMLKG